MVALEAWALGRPVLANGKCDVLKGQCMRSNAGLYLRDATASSSRRCEAIEQNRWLSRIARPQRPAVLSRPLRLAGDRAEVSRHVRAADEGRRRRAGQPIRCPAGSIAGRAGSAGRPSEVARAKLPNGRRPGDAGDPDPPGAGDARLRRRHRPRGARHPARAARRRLRVGDLRRDRRSPARAADARLSRAGRLQPSATTCCCIISRSARRRRAPPSRCPIGWRSSTTTSRRRNISSACTARWRGSAFAAGASCGPTPTAAIWRSATRSSTARISRRSGFPRTAVLPVVPDFSHLDRAAELAGRRASSTTTGPTSCSSAG